MGKSYNKIKRFYKKCKIWEVSCPVWFTIGYATDPAAPIKKWCG